MQGRIQGVEGVRTPLPAESVIFKENGMFVTLLLETPKNAPELAH
jgi:hypothetical protein